ncbi:MAG: hypothetical protein LBT26_05410, partial [Clostridiales Family XIII bacterium]|nr:hypothetical protein [Clostridiales Family XIII bacterium]
MLAILAIEIIKLYRDIKKEERPASLALCRAFCSLAIVVMPYSPATFLAMRITSAMVMWPSLSTSAA